jgi:hypothetical protein
MSQISQLGACCNVVIRSLDEQNTNLPTFKIQNPGTLAALLMPDNLQGVSMANITDAAGRTVINRVRYFKNPRASAEDGWQNFCTPGDTTGQNFKDYPANIVKSVKLTLSEAEFRDFCGIPADGNASNISLTEFGVQQTRAKANELLKAVSNAFSVQLAANTGKFADGSTSKNAQLLTTVGGVDANGEVLVRRSFEDLELPTDGIIAVGSGNLSEYWYKRQYACCSDAGVNVSNVTSPLMYFRDSAIGSVTSNSNTFIAWSAGAAVPFFRQMFVGPYIKNGSDGTVNIRKIPIQLPFNFNGINYNIPVDFTAKYVECGSSDAEASPENGPDSYWVLTWTITAGLATIPTDIEVSGSPFEGVNNILKFIATCGQQAYCS